ncbi:HPr family phosphocarrier protein [Flexivirga meconopsidis]|uniref:HPr family phosphocarrier protein n=1 Tax=Flexivirga meconopsidis TaxID=2977121 RepID=UPI00223F5393|nr:HPr family phosphocarrier protein [Flexivirga meconopsidis]
MPTRSVEIASAVGLHARPAALFVQAATATGDTVTIGRPGDEAVDGTSILAVMGLGAKHGEMVEVSVQGDDSDDALDTLITLLATDLDAPG